MPLSPLYRAFYADGSQIDVHANTAQMEQEIREKVSPEEALGYRRYVDFVTKLYKYEMHDFIDKNIDSPLNLLTPNLARLIALGGFRHLQPKVNQYLKDPRLQKVYSFQAMYAGVSPQSLHTWTLLTASSSPRAECMQFLALLRLLLRSMVLSLSTTPQ
jgi:phytoene desaturase